MGQPVWITSKLLATGPDVMQCAKWYSYPHIDSFHMDALTQIELGSNLD